MNDATTPARTCPRVLVTRPAQQQTAFASALRQAGFEPIGFPCLTIDAVPFNLVPSSLACFSRALFTSANAVRFASASHPLPWPLPLEAIGPATARALASAGQPPWRGPIAPYDSEAWLADLDRAIAGGGATPPESVLIVTGVGGRNVLQQGLADRGIDCHAVAVYRRDLPRPTDDERDRRLVLGRPDILTVTSDEGLRNLVTLAGERHLPRLLNLPLVVNSQRAAALAARLGFRQPARVANPPGDEGQLAALRRWRDEISLR